MVGVTPPLDVLEDRHPELGAGAPGPSSPRVRQAADPHVATRATHRIYPEASARSTLSPVSWPVTLPSSSSTASGVLRPAKSGSSSSTVVWTPTASEGSSRAPARSAMLPAVTTLARGTSRVNSATYSSAGLSTTRAGVPDPEVADLARELAERLGIEECEIDDEEFLNRCLFSSVDDGAKILEEGIVDRTSDIDVI